MRFILATNLRQPVLRSSFATEGGGYVRQTNLHEMTLMFISRQVFSCSQTPDLACSQTPVWEHTRISNSVSGRVSYSLSHDSHVASRGTPTWESLMKGLQSWAACVKTDEMLDIFSTPSNSPYLGGESISFCRRQFPSPSIGGRVRDGGSNNLKKSFSHRLWGFVIRSKE